MNLITSSSECGRQRREKLVGSDKSCAYLKSSETEERRDSLWNHCEPNTGSSFPLCSAGAQSKAAVNGLCSRQVLKESIQRRRYFTSPLVFLWWAKKKNPFVLSLFALLRLVTLISPLSTDTHTRGVEDVFIPDARWRKTTASLCTSGSRGPEWRSAAFKSNSLRGSSSNVNSRGCHQSHRRRH